MNKFYRTSVEAKLGADGPYFVARHPELPGCMSDGDTWPEAVENLRSARRDYIEALAATGMNVPEPTCEFHPMYWDLTPLPNGVFERKVESEDKLPLQEAVSQAELVMA